MDNYFLITDNKCFSTTKLFLLPIDTKKLPNRAKGNWGAKD